MKRSDPCELLDDLVDENRVDQEDQMWGVPDPTATAEIAGTHR